VPATVAFGVNEMMRLRTKLRDIPHNELETVEGAAQHVVRLLRDELVDDQGRTVCVLARVYKTHRYAALDEPLQAFARTLDASADTVPDLRCLVLLATAGREPDWNSRTLSRGHRAIPLSSEQAVARAPMILQLVQQLGLDLATVIQPDRSVLLNADEHAHNVFYVREAAGSPFIPAQEDFVLRHGVKSVVGFGGIATSGDLFTAILFSRAEITPEAAEHFKVIGLNFKLAMLQHTAKPLFGAAAANGIQRAPSA
jgi:hypothetical protein